MSVFLSIYSSKQRLKRAAPGLDPYVGGERYFEYSTLLPKLQGLLSAGSILDIGSSNSLLPTLLVERGYKVTCVDPYKVVEHQREFARKMHDPSHLQVALADGANLPFPSSSFDAVTCISTVEHIPDSGDTASLCEFSRVLKPDGMIFLSFPWQKFYYEYWGNEPLYVNDNSSELKLIARSYDLHSLGERLLHPAGLQLKYGVRGAAPNGIHWMESILRQSPVPSLADLYRGRKYVTESLGDECLHRRYVAVLICEKYKKVN